MIQNKHHVTPESEARIIKFKSALKSENKDDYRGDVREFMLTLTRSEAYSREVGFKGGFKELRGHATKTLAQIESGKTNSTCDRCGAKFEFYRLGFDGNEVATVPTCEACLTQELIAANEKRRIAVFIAENPMARYYLSKSGKPPKPGQFSEVLAHGDGDGDKDNLAIFGDSFKGKTTAAVHLCEKKAKSGDEVRIVEHTELNDIPNMVRDGSIREFMDELKHVEVLLIDDLDKCRITPRVASEIWGLIEYRTRTNPSQTIVTMNTPTKRAFIAMFSSSRADEDARKTGLSLYNRMIEHFDWIDFDV